MNSSYSWYNNADIMNNNNNSDRDEIRCGTSVLWSDSSEILLVSFIYNSRYIYTL